MSLPTIPHDKALHFIYGVLIAIAVLVACTLFQLDPTKASITAVFVSFVAGILKEVYDAAWKNGTDDYMDVVYTLTGGIAAVIGRLL